MDFALFENGTFVRFITPDETRDIADTIRRVRDLSNEERAALGIYPVQVGPRPNEEFMWTREPLITLGQDNVALMTWPDAGYKDLAQIKSLLKNRLAARRWRAETQGLSANGVLVATDEISQQKIAGATTSALLAILKAQPDPAFVPIVSLFTQLGINGFPLNWKGDNGWVSVDAPTLIAIANAVRVHVQNCFNNEQAISGQIDAAVDAQSALAVNLEANWPVAPA